MNYGYIRVSTEKQTVENQRFEITQFCERNHLSIDGWIEETVSGTKEYKKRKLGTLLHNIGKGDLIISTELSRLGRTLFMIMEILSYCMDHGCQVWTVKDGYRLGNDIQAKVLAFAFGIAAEIERNLISQRTKEALRRLKAEGKPVGRDFGTRPRQSTYRLYRHEKYIRQRLEEGMSQREIARRLHCSRNTLALYMKSFMMEEEE